MFNNNHIISHYINISMSYVTRTYACTTYGRLAIPYNAITACETTRPCNKAIWARRTKIGQSPLPIHYENYKLLTNYFIHIWAVPRDSHLLLGGLDYDKLLFYEYLSALLNKYMF